MKPVLAALFVLLTLTACGVDGEPIPPTVGVSTTVGVNSSSGGYSDTSISIHFPSS